MTCPALFYPALCPVRSCPAHYTISGRSDRKVLRLIYTHDIEIMTGDIFGNELYTTTVKIESQSKRHMNRQHKVRVIGYI